MLISSIVLVFILIVKSGVLCISLRITPASPVVVASGANITILCQAGVPITFCHFQVPGSQKAPLTINTSSSKGKFEYFGKGLQTGDCGLAIQTINETLEGDVVCIVGTKHEALASTATAKIIVQRKPAVPILTIRTPLVNQENDTLKATCVVQGSRPPVNITWYLDSDVITQEIITTITPDDGSLTHTTVSNLTRRVSWNDNGKKLGCGKNHLNFTYGDGPEVTKTIEVLYAPKEFQTVMEPGDFKVGKPGSISITLKANPQPKLTWLFEDQIVTSGSHDTSGRFYAEFPVNLGDGQWWLVLKISTVISADYGFYVLKASNNIGEEKYPITVMKSTQRAGTGRNFGSSLIATSVTVALIILVLVVIAIVAVVRAVMKTSADETVLLPEDESQDQDESPATFEQHYVSLPISEHDQ